MSFACHVWSVKHNSVTDNELLKKYELKLW